MINLIYESNMINKELINKMILKIKKIIKRKK